jgi:hypothetical protein
VRLKNYFEGEMKMIRTTKAFWGFWLALVCFCVMVYCISNLVFSHSVHAQQVDARNLQPSFSLIAQPITLKNIELTSGSNSAVTDSIPAVSGQRVAAYRVSARCSAGTGQLTVKDGVGGTTIWTTAATEVSTTTFVSAWSTPLSSTLGNGMDITLGTCGVSNTGTLDVQASQF